MIANTIVATDAGVEAYLAAIEDPKRRADCDAIVKLMRAVTKKPPVMWGSSIVGFDSYHYRYDSGREGDWCVTGFYSRKGDISVYLVAAGPKQESLLAKLGRYRIGKSCLYLRSLADVDVKVLRELVEDSVAEVKRRHG
ncbi:DUF1801 domain-containing protein [Dokdonella sp.]|uniref:DUF1801 domain-containing protein n=1 Tax=Dokdonella sp. TaxID=2291710 RepID=UPI0025BFCFCD|nr:DUF1801 domain-containing protein [Dokdonella sp.]MBX3691068.1 DUF1801 domain-containing protein [Dokdonella sp.]